ncbi:MAG: cobalt ABC transporter ATP-binding protein [Deltaproteobacteria bacterium CG11_big_fil_rev_8_21_14_0_20_49_13]|nr:MAG: cobalt ABC transporter ATP-binding protein [Deltaproteobacteria bacterium CG11_big_fil_rev_8_21_14_0_20_49_13]
MNAIETNDLGFSYPDGTPALLGIDLQVKEGESIGLIGPNGAGKSTLLLCLNGVFNASGTASILGKELSKDNMPFIRSKLGIVFQDPDVQLFMSSVFDDVAFGPLNMGVPKEKIAKVVLDALEKVGMGTSEQRSSHHLSFGEKKRVALATVLSMEPQVLLLDEPSSNLDPKNRRRLMELLNSFTHTKIIASHDLDLVERCCSRVVLLSGGKISAQGPASDIISDKELLKNSGLW